MANLRQFRRALDPVSIDWVLAYKLIIGQQNLAIGLGYGHGRGRVTEKILLLKC